MTMEESTPLFPLSLRLHGSCLDSAQPPCSLGHEDALAAPCSRSPEAEQVCVGERECACALEVFGGRACLQLGP